MKNKGFVGVIIGIGMFAGILGLIWLVGCIRWQPQNEVVSGVIYNTYHNAFISGSSHFSVRASENTVVTEENASKFCLPPDSEYIDIINDAAKDKSLKVVVYSDQVPFGLVAAPWTCVDNIRVERVQDDTTTN